MSSRVYEELKSIIMRWPIWVMLGTQDIKMRYRRSSIGPFWITISTAVTIYCMGFLYGHLFKLDLATYFPYLGAGIIGWTLLSTLMIESCHIFIESENYIRNQESFMSLFMMRLILRNMTIFAHNLLAFMPIIFIFHLGTGLSLLALIPGLFLIALNVLCWGMVLAILGTRYRDIAQMINSIVQVIFFLTPVMWMPKLLPERIQWAITYNPFYHFLNLIRAPLLNQPWGADTLWMVMIVSVMGALSYLAMTHKYTQRVIFWL